MSAIGILRQSMIVELFATTMRIGEQIMPEEIAALDRRISKLRNYVLILALLWAATTGAWLMKTSPYVARAAQPENLTVKRLAVVDEKGTERVVISAPLPEPMINGKRGKRDSSVSGMLIYDPKGNERGGYVTSDGGDLAALLTLDSENDQVFTAYANAGSGATVWVANEKHQNVVMSDLPPAFVHVRIRQVTTALSPV